MSAPPILADLERPAHLQRPSESDFLLPQLARFVIASGDFEGSPRRSLAEKLAVDPVICRRLLQWINGPLFNMPRRLVNLRDVSTVLSEKGLAQLAVLASARTLFQPNHKIGRYSREGLWRHSVAVGAVASLIARTCKVSSPNQALVAGTLHDIGLLASERRHVRRFKRLVNEMTPVLDTAKTEDYLFGWDHQTFGAEILAAWGLPNWVCQVAQYHHLPQRALRLPSFDLICCVSIANYLCSRCQWTSLGVHNVAPPPDMVFMQLKINTKVLTALWRQLYQTLQDSRSLC